MTHGSFARLEARRNSAGALSAQNNPRLARCCARTLATLHAQEFIDEEADAAEVGNLGEDEEVVVITD